ncbi:MAG: Xaa-Pro peptidase family protein, partial [Aquificaceae bacterium]|nr:Xaa-Pro peptidase family protein [Aquificaceae bacterium]
MRKKRQIQELLERHELDAFLFSSQANVFYLSGFRSTHAYVIVSHGPPYLLTDSRYYEKAKGSLKGWQVVLIEGNPLKTIYGVLRQIEALKVGYEQDRVSCEFSRKLKGGFHWVGVSGFLKNLRAVKDREEIETLQEGVRASDRVYTKVLENLREGLTELEVRAMLLSEFFKEGAIGESFPAIVASGAGSAIPHWETSSRRIKAGEPLLIDMGMLWKGYCTDFTRTVYLGRAPAEFKKVYSVVRDAHLFALEKVKVGKKIGEVDRAAREYIKKKGFGRFFTHSTGHGVGVEIHEFPRVYYKG